MSSTLYTGVKVVETDKETINTIYITGEKDLKDFDARLKFYQNEYVVLKCSESGQSALTRVKNYRLVLLDKDVSAAGIKPKNKEQRMALDALLDESIGVVCLTGKAGTGKTLCSLAAAMEQMEQGVYDRIIITRPTSQVGKRELGILPGELQEKISPYFINYFCNLEQIIKTDKKNRNMRTANTDAILERYNIEMVPLQLIRGASWVNTLIIADEVQVLDFHEMATLGTRVGEKSKLILLGDLNQRDEKIAKDKTGLYKFVNDEKAKESNLVASIELLKSERGPISALFADVFEV